MNLESSITVVETVTIRLDGRLDAVHAPELRTALREAIDRGAIRILIDLSDVEFVDSAGLAALVHAMKACRELGGDVELARPRSDDAYRVFELTRFDAVFSIRPARD